MLCTKTESYDMIVRKGLNRLKSWSLHGGGESVLKEILENNKDKTLNIRDCKKSSSSFMYNISAEEVFKVHKKYDSYKLYESLAEYDKDLILQGDIIINKEFEILAQLSDIKSISNREAMSEPKYLVEVDLKENREPSIKGLTYVVDYLIKNELIGMIVEFTLYGKGVGLNKEPIIIWELRNY